MDNYYKHETVNHKVNNPFSELLQGETVCKVQVSPYTPLNKVLGFALRKMKDTKTTLMMVQGQGKAVENVRKCVQVVMGKHSNIHRCDALSYKIHEDIWLPIDASSDLTGLSVKHHIPALFVVLAKNDLPQSLKAHPSRLQVTSSRRRANS